MNRSELIRSLGAAGAVTAMLALRANAAEPPDHVITIEETAWEVRPGLEVRTKSYGGAVARREHGPDTDGNARTSSA